MLGKHSFEPFPLLLETAAIVGLKWLVAKSRSPVLCGNTHTWLVPTLVSTKQVSMFKIITSYLCALLMSCCLMIILLPHWYHCNWRYYYSHASAADVEKQIVKLDGTMTCLGRIAVVIMLRILLE